MFRTFMLISLAIVWTLVLLPRAHVTLRYWWRRKRTFIPISSFHDYLLDDYELAMLNAGRHLVVLVALLNLRSAGALELSRVRPDASPLPNRGKSAPSVVTFKSSPQITRPPIEKAVCKAVLGGNHSPERIESYAGVGAVMDGLEQHLVDVGLFHSDAELLKITDREPWFYPAPSRRTPLGEDLVRRLQKTHRAESLGSLIAGFGAPILWRTGPKLAHMLHVPRPQGGGVFAPRHPTGRRSVNPGAGC